MEVGECEFDEDNIPQLEDMVSVCAGLVTVDEESSVIRLVHYTTQEFFDRTQQQWFPNAASEITSVCITYLSFAVFAKGFYQTNAGYKERLHSNPFYHYAANNWGHHARKAMTSHQDVRDSLQSYNRAKASNQALMAVKPLPASSGYSVFSLVFRIKTDDIKRALDSVDGIIPTVCSVRPFRAVQILFSARCRGVSPHNSRR